jgi:hypothetical protein
MVANYIKDKGLPCEGSGRSRRFRWSEVREWFIRYRLELELKAGNAGSEAVLELSSESFDEALRRKTIAEAELKELELATKRGLVVAVVDVERNIANVSNALRTKILGWPTKMVGRILGIREKTQLFAVLTNSARELCLELAAVGSQPLPEAEAE